MVVPFLVLLPQARGIPLGQLGLIFGVHSVVAIALEVPSGGLADAIGRRTTLVAGGLLTVASLAVFAVATGLAGFMAAVATLAAGRALMSGALEAWFVDELRLADPEAVLHGPLAAGSTSEGLAAGVGAAVGGFLPLLPLGLDETGDAALVQLSLPLVGGAVAALAFVVALVVLVQESTPRRARGVRGVLAGTLAMTREGVGAARRSRDIRLILCLGAVLGMVLSMTEVLWPTRLSELLDTQSSDAGPLFGLLAAASMAAFAAGSALSTRVARRTGKRAAFAGAYVALAVTLALLGLVGVAALFCAVFLLYLASVGVADPLHYEILHDATGPETRATVVSLEGLTVQSGGLVGNFGLVPLAGVAGIGVAWGAAGAIALGASLVAAAVATPRRRPAAPSAAV
jgi:MFS family permease